MRSLHVAALGFGERSKNAKTIRKMLLRNGPLLMACGDAPRLE